VGEKKVFAKHCYRLAAALCGLKTRYFTLKEKHTDEKILLRLTPCIYLIKTQTFVRNFTCSLSADWKILTFT